MKQTEREANVGVFRKNKEKNKRAREEVDSAII